MATVDVGVQRSALLRDATTFGQLPPELRDIIGRPAAPDFLDAVAEAALIPRIAGRIFIHFEPIFPDLCARWILGSGSSAHDERVVASFARILPFAPYLSVYLENFLTSTQGSQLRSLLTEDVANSPKPEQLLCILVAVWRLINFEKRTYAQLALPSTMQALFRHEDAAVRYVAIRIFCQLLGASDAKLECLIEEHINKHTENKGSLMGDFDGSNVDYTFLTLHEHRRAEDLEEARRNAQASRTAEATSSPYKQTLTHFVASYGNVIIPRPLGIPQKATTLIHTATTAANLENLARLLLKPGPILLHGLTGSGKTSLVHEAARELGMVSSIVTLHLNEQTDAKMLIGLYTTDAKPGSFSWRPGVLTTAVKEGRWVLIEDLDRAPNEVMSTLLPLIERGELLIPGRGETVRAPSTFRIFATVRTSTGMYGQEIVPNLLGLRFWQRLSIQQPPRDELREIILGLYPLLQRSVNDIMSVFNNLEAFVKRSSGSVGRGALDRHTSPRDLLKWSRRLANDGRVTGDGPINIVNMLMEAIDCFTGSVKDESNRKTLISEIAMHMHLHRDQVDHYLSGYTPRLEENEAQLVAGRVTLRKRKNINRVAKSRRPFAATTHAKRLLEQIAVAVNLNEPVLLVGETGIGKTTVVQQLAESLGHKLVAINLSQQSEVGDLLGGYKPVNVRSLAVPLKEEFEDLFASTGNLAERNQKYLEQIGKRIAKGKWREVSKLWRQAPKMFNDIVNALSQSQSRQTGIGDEGQPAKRRKTEPKKLQALLQLKPRWDAFALSLDQFDVQLSGGSAGFAFAFVEGKLVKAVRNGDWVLLDEINLASHDTLESIADLLQSGPDSPPSILLSETGEIERIQAHPSFRVFGAMNPATDVGKRDLPVGLRSRFTEIYVESPDKDPKDLLSIIETYLKRGNIQDRLAADDVAKLYTEIKKRAAEKRLVDGANEVPHFSLRTLTRVLTYVNDIAPYYGLRRALFEGFSMGFLTLLDQGSEKMLVPLMQHYLFGKLGNTQTLLSQSPKLPKDGREYVRFPREKFRYWLLKGQEAPQVREDYIITNYVERNLLNLVRATSTRRFPVLIQGPTSAGKTSMIEYLAHYSGNKFVRINNHEHTDLQEYLGTYMSGPDGKLKFQEGLLVQAMRQGHWIVLDELNLAPTDVLEALNRLLDDNRELLIPETQEIVRPHEGFMLFATQNPPGLYGGRKVLSRAFRNRFLELHFDDIPKDELEEILQRRCRNVAPSDCRRIVKVYKELSGLRQTDRLFEQKDSFATLRDLFRWASRDADTRQQIAMNGFMLLAERVRNEEERTKVKEVIEKEFLKIESCPTIDPEILYSPASISTLGGASNHGVVWTKAMRRLYVLVERALHNNEPVLLIGETGCGKTTVCQMLAEAFGKQLYIVNAQQNTETGDLIGSQRPVRNRGAVADLLRQELLDIFKTTGYEFDGSTDDLLERYHALDPEAQEKVPKSVHDSIMAKVVKSRALFEWSDGSLVHAMKGGQFFLLDEISLADDSVLERLNSVLEPQRSLLLAEKGVDNSNIQASDGFQFLATMNPGGDFGKKELSPALRNRFTEIWVPPLSQAEDIYEIVQSKLNSRFKHFADAIVKFAYWFGREFRSSSSTALSIRDILVWVNFINVSANEEPVATAVHGAATVFIDSLGANPSALTSVDSKTMAAQRLDCLKKLGELLGHKDVPALYFESPELRLSEDELAIGGYSIERCPGHAVNNSFALNAPTTRLNAMRLVRSLQVKRPVLLEGNPGVGKTTLVSALAQACGRPLTRINLSDQTDLMDLFGTDVPVEGAEAGNFAWRDAPFLQAMQKGEWVLLDEMNLASQSVLEGLNACLDHRGEVYISELDQVFKCHPDFRLFAAQNPHHQGGGRKGLPSSFVNRFIVVYADIFTDEDLRLIATHNFPSVPADVIQQLIDFIFSLEDNVAVKRMFGGQGAPWEFNLRDILRWLQLLGSDDPLLSTGNVVDFLNIIVRQRFRSETDRQFVNRLYATAFGAEVEDHSLYHNVDSFSSQVGLGLLQRDQIAQQSVLTYIDMVPRLAEIESLMICVKKSLPCILVGHSGSGKSTLVKHVAGLAGKELVVFPLNADVDTMDLVGGFEQSDPQREVQAHTRELKGMLQSLVLSVLPQEAPTSAVNLFTQLLEYEQKSTGREDVASLTRELLQVTSPDSALALALQRLLALLGRPMVLENPRFEWVDGVIVKAVQTGQWLVLDNANLCSASVLDRLNSLLEPNGFLSINEHSRTDGEPRVITPHPDFRIFLTTDPKYGELSRAMRNRSVEIYLEPVELHSAAHLQHLCPVESSMQRYRAAEKVARAWPHGEARDILGPLALDNLFLDDMSYLSAYAGTLEHGPAQHQHGISPEYRQRVGDLQHYRAAGNLDIVGQAVHSLYRALPGVALSHVYLSKQPVHPLQNAPLVYLAEAVNPGTCQWLAACFEYYSDIQRAVEAMQTQTLKINVTKPSTLNRLQRSSSAKQIHAAAKDSTVDVAEFLISTLQHIRTFVMPRPQSTDAGAWMERIAVARILFRYWWTTFHLVCSQNFDEARFQAHLHLGKIFIPRGLLSHIEDENSLALVSKFEGLLGQSFTANAKLSTGTSMEELWLTFRPLPIADSATFTRVLEMEDLANRFDAMRWRANSSIPDLKRVMKLLAQAYGVVRTAGQNASTLIQELESEVGSLEGNVMGRTEGHPPFFSGQFESLRRLLVFQQLSSDGLHSELIETINVLAGLPTGRLMRLQGFNATAAKLQFPQNILCQETGVYPWSGRVFSSILQKLEKVGSAPMSALRSLENELPFISQSLSGVSIAMSTGHVSNLNGLLWRLLLDVISSLGNEHQDDFILAYQTHSQALLPSQITIKPNGIELLDSSLAGLCSHPYFGELRQDVRDNFSIAITALAASNRGFSPMVAYSSIAWVQFAIGCIRMFVPDKAFDPYLRSQVERTFLDELREGLDRKATNLTKFQQIFTAQSSSLRIQLLNDELRDLPTPPIVKPIHRPSGPEAGHTQGVFNNVLNTTLAPYVTSVHFEYLVSASESSSQEINNLRDNITRLSERLSGRLSPYQDITEPVVGMLRCLQIGLSLAEAPGDEASLKIASPILGATPFLGGSMRNTAPSFTSANGTELLTFAGTAVSVEGLDSISDDLRQSIFASIHSYYEQWTKKLEADRRAEEAKSSLYHFKGSAEDEEEFDEKEFQQMFPTYDLDSESYEQPKAKQPTARDLALMLTALHKDIFLPYKSPAESVQHLAKNVGRKLADESNDTSKPTYQLDKMLYPAVLMILKDEIDGFYSEARPDRYNFYLDANLPEVRKVVGLVNAVQSHFIELQRIDEIAHLQPLEEVIKSCTKTLELEHTEPLAKILPRVEQLHGAVYECQHGGWLSQTYLNPSHYKGLTDTIVGWRRLELATWGKLFDMELTKCKEDAKSWFFLAYQDIIAKPLGMVQSGGDLQAYSVSLLKDLGKYFSSCIKGQFSARLDLVKQLLKQVDLLTVDFPALDAVRSPIQGFVEMHGRYERVVAESIHQGRAPIEKSVKDVLFFAKWEDTNIQALRESARKSHQKLFRLVRKYRGVLGQQMQPLIDQGLPDFDESKFVSIAQGQADTVPQIDEQPGLVCAELIPTWGKDPQSNRLADIKRIISIMSKAGTLPGSLTDIVEFIGSFDTDLLSSISALRKETPATLTDENKDQVKHLKSRKVKLFSDTLKDLRRMGFRRNLGQDLLAQQSSLAVLMSRTSPIPQHHNDDFSGMEYYFHKVIDLAPRFREATRDHSDDLHAEAVQRSIGLLEGILHVVMQQRGRLIESITACNILEATIEDVHSLTNSVTDSVVRNQRETSNSQQALKWLIAVTEVGSHLVQTHAYLGKSDHQKAQSGLNTWREKLLSLNNERTCMASVPTSFTSVSFLQWEQRLRDTFHAFHDDLSEIVTAQPELAFAIEEVRLWTKAPVLGQDASNIGGIDIASLTNEVLNLSGKVLNAIQKFGSTSSELPASMEEEAWLTRASSGLSTVLASLHMNTVTRGIKACIANLVELDLDNASSRTPSTALLALVLPILQQYAITCNQSIQKMSEFHLATCKMTCHLSKTFIQLASQGFCTPQETSNESSGESGKLESGTGLGEGEGAEDISKDIQPDEDLTELAQEPNKEERGEIEDEKDAVDMGNDEMEGDLGSVAGTDNEDDNQSKSGDEEDDTEMDEETGEVDDLDPTAVDEKMWDGDNEEAEKDQEGEKSKGQKNKEEQVASNDAKGDDAHSEGDGSDQEDTMEDEAGQQEEDVQAREELNQQDQNVQENEALALPEDMDLDGDEQNASSEDDDLDKLSDIAQDEQQQGDEEEDFKDEMSGDEKDTSQPEKNNLPDDSEMSETEESKVQQEEDIDTEQQPLVENEEHDEVQDKEMKDPSIEDKANGDKDAVPSDVKSGGGLDQDSPEDEGNEATEANSAQREQGNMGEADSNEQTKSGNKGAMSMPDGEPPQSEENKAAEHQREQPFRKLGDALEKWFRNQKEIQTAPDDQEARQDKGESELDASKQEFQHLQDENAPADTQALGGAPDEDVQPFDDSMAIDNENEEQKAQDHLLPEDMNNEEVDQDNMSVSGDDEAPKMDQEDRDHGRSGVATKKGAYDQDVPMSPLESNVGLTEEDEVQETSTQLSVTHITGPESEPRDYAESAQLWTDLEAKTQCLSHKLTSQLRLILTPSQSTKLSGSYRTGKRLNIKKIIPYIASSYKRDKIWMRRAIPTKRAYQILLCVDDSKSMGESNSGALALESLVMVSRALTRLEAGQVGVLGFGADVFEAHDLAQPFASLDAGARTLQRFAFSQDHTDMALLVRRTIERFRAARLQNTSGGAAEDLWQLALVLTDGVTPGASLDTIRRLLREAAEERIMVVCIIMDDAARTKGNSVLDLKEARFVKDANGNTTLDVERYLDRFPFQYYLVVHHLEELPEALAGLLRTWFAEVNA